MPGPDSAGREEQQVRRVLRAARSKSLVAAIPLLFIMGPMLFRDLPLVVRLLPILLLAAVLAGYYRRIAAQDLRGPLRRATVEHTLGAEVVIRLDDGALWGFTVEPQDVPRLRVGEPVTLPEPRPGDVVLARRDPWRQAYVGLRGRGCRLYRPAPTTYVTPVAALAGGPAELSREQAAVFLAYEEARLRAHPLAARGRRAVLADIGTEPTLESVVVESVWAHRVRVRRADGASLGWPIEAGTSLLALGSRVWATRPEEGLYVVLVTLVDDGRRTELVWPEEPAIAEGSDGPGCPAGPQS